VSILKDEALEFSKLHITKYYDSDFFPRAMEFDAIWHNWASVKQHLLSKNISKLTVSVPRAMAARKPKGSYRVVHQMESLDALVYTALAFQIAPDIENARVPVGEHVACSYRFNVVDGNFFGSGSGYENFQNKSEALAAELNHVLSTDITDFYNQIYLHRLNGAIAEINPDLAIVSDDIEQFISRLNNGASKGIPVGPAGSIVMSEAVLRDIDSFILRRGVAHTRYVDDIRIFSNSRSELDHVLQELTMYLYQQHRLTLSGEKTAITSSAEFLAAALHNDYEEARTALFKTLDEINPYSIDDDFEEEVNPEEDIDDAVVTETLEEVIARVRNTDKLDLGLARSVIRRAKRNGAEDLVRPLMDDFEFFSPVINDVMLYFSAITNDDNAESYVDDFVSIIDLETAKNDLVRYWLGWYLSDRTVFQQNDNIREFLYSGPIENQARAALTVNNLTWVRERKADISNLSPRGRRAVLYASQILPADERNHWLRMMMGGTEALTDRWVAQWVLETGGNP